MRSRTISAGGSALAFSSASPPRSATRTMPARFRYIPTNDAMLGSSSTTRIACFSRPPPGMVAHLPATGRSSSPLGRLSTEDMRPCAARPAPPRGTADPVSSSRPLSTASRVTEPLTLPPALAPRPLMMPATSHRSPRPDQAADVAAANLDSSLTHSPDAPLTSEARRPGVREIDDPDPASVELDVQRALSRDRRSPVSSRSSTNSAPGVRSSTGTAPNAASADPAARAATVARTRSRRIRGELSSHAMRLQLPACKESVNALGRVSDDVRPRPPYHRRGLRWTNWHGMIARCASSRRAWRPSRTRASGRRGERAFEPEIIAALAATRHAADLGLISPLEGDTVWAAVARRHPRAAWCRRGPRPLAA